MELLLPSCIPIVQPILLNIYSVCKILFCKVNSWLNVQSSIRLEIVPQQILGACLLMCVTCAVNHVYPSICVVHVDVCTQISVSIRILSSHERKCLWKLHLDHVILIDLINQVCLCIFLCSHTWSVCRSNLVAVVEAHAAQSWQFGLQTVVSWLLLLLVVELLPLDLLPHAPRLLDGLHYRVLVPKQRCGVEAGQDVWEGRRTTVCHFH